MGGWVLAQAQESMAGKTISAPPFACGMLPACVCAVLRLIGQGDAVQCGLGGVLGCLWSGCMHPVLGAWARVGCVSQGLPSLGAI